MVETAWKYGTAPIVPTRKPTLVGVFDVKILIEPIAYMPGWATVRRPDVTPSEVINVLSVDRPEL